MNQITKIAGTERARQAGYDAGYADALTVAKRKPTCPEWCLPNWCAVTPLVNSEGTVWNWSGWHIGDMRTVDIAYGLIAQVAIAAPEDDPQAIGVYLRLAAHEDDGEVVAMLTEGEARKLALTIAKQADSVDIFRDLEGGPAATRLRP